MPAIKGRSGSSAADNGNSSGRQQLADTFHDCAHGVISPDAEQQAQELIYGLEGLNDLKDPMLLMKW